MKKCKEQKRSKTVANVSDKRGVGQNEMHMHVTLAYMHAIASSEHAKPRQLKRPTSRKMFKGPIQYLQMSLQILDSFGNDNLYI